MSEEKHNGMKLKQILVTAVVTGAVGVTTGMLLFNLQLREPRLTFEIKESLPFDGDREKLAVYHVTIKNGGKKVVETVDSHVSVAPAIIKEARIALSPSISYTSQTTGSVYEAHLKSLNPGEDVTVSLLASSQGALPSRPTVAVRGLGVNGLEASKKKEESFFEGPIFAALLSGYTVLAALLATRVYFRRHLRMQAGLLGLEGEDDGVHSDKQNEILAYLFGLRSMLSETQAYLNKSHPSSYWSESDRIAAVALASPDPKEKEARRQVLLDLLRYARIAKSSQAIVHYNIYRIACALGLSDEGEKHLTEAKKLLPKLIETRMMLDPICRKTS